MAILFVLAYHYTVRWAPPRDPSPHLAAGRIFNGFIPFEYGLFGVEFFFVISGFVILMTLERCRNIGDFACRRFARLWPPLVVAASLTTIIMFLIGPVDWLVSGYDYATSILLISPGIMSRLLHHSGIKWVDGAYWSLWVEVRFYLWAGIVYLAVRRNFVRWWLAIQVAVLGILLLADVLHPGPGVYGFLRLVAFPDYLPYFTLGVCIYEIYSRGAQYRPALVGVALSCGIILYSAAFEMGVYAGTDARISVVVNLMIFVLFFLFLVDHPLVGLFKTRPMVALGQASYSLYLIHQHVGVAVMRKCMNLGVPYLLALPLTAALIIATAFPMFRIIEVPAKSWILRRSRKLILDIDILMPWLRYNPTQAGK